jgi:heptosyltransferase-1
MVFERGLISGSEKVLLNRYSAMGDVLRVMPYAKALKDAYPNIHLTWFVCNPWDELVRCQPYVDEVIVWEQSARNLNFIKAISEIRKRKFDILLCFQGTDRGALLSLLSGIPVRVGAHRWADFAYTHNAEDVGKFIGLDVKQFERPWIYVTKEAEEKAKGIREKVNGPLLFSIVGASKAVKRWPAGRWIELSDLLGHLGWSMVLVGHGEEEENLAWEIVRSSKGLKVINMVGKLNLVETAALAMECDAAVGGDTGFLHMAKLIGLPAVGLFGPTLPGNVGLDDIGVNIVVSCDDAGCERWDCPNQDCLGSIDAKQVIDSLKELLTGF